MHKRSKSTPKPSIFLEQIFGNPNKRGTQRSNQSKNPPEQHLHINKNYLNSSPLRNCQKIKELRAYKSPFKENNFERKPSKPEIVAFLSKSSMNERIYTNKIISSCRYSISKANKLEPVNENAVYFTNEDKNEACLQYSEIQRQISNMFKLRNRRKNYSLCIPN